MRPRWRCRSRRVSAVRRRDRALRWRASCTDFRRRGRTRSSDGSTARVRRAKGEHRWLAQPQQRRRSSRTAERERWTTRRSRRSATPGVDRRRRERRRAGRLPRRALPPRSALPPRRAHGSPRRRRNDRRHARPRRRSGAASRRTASGLGTARRRTSDEANETDGTARGGSNARRREGTSGPCAGRSCSPRRARRASKRAKRSVRTAGRLMSSVRGRAARSLEPSSPVRPHVRSRGQGPHCDHRATWRGGRRARRDVERRRVRGADVLLRALTVLGSAEALGANEASQGTGA